MCLADQAAAAAVEDFKVGEAETLADVDHHQQRVTPRRGHPQKHLPPRRPGGPHPRRPVAAVTDDPAPPTDQETSIVAALRARLTAKDAQIADLKAALRERDRTISVLHGELDKLHAAGG